jgi:hydrogenase maturation protease
MTRILVACIGNIFMGDDAFGVEVAARLARKRLPENVRVVDYGIRGLDLAYALMDGYDACILVDAVPRGGAPGTLYTMEPDWDSVADESALIDAHGMNPMQVLATVRAMGGRPKRVLLIGCEPAPYDGDEAEERMGLSGPVQEAVGPAAGAIETLVRSLLEGGNDGRQGSESGPHRGGGGVLCHAAARPEALREDEHDVTARGNLDVSSNSGESH